MTPEQKKAVVETIDKLEKEQAVRWTYEGNRQLQKLKYTLRMLK